MLVTKTTTTTTTTTTRLALLILRLSVATLLLHSALAFTRAPLSFFKMMRRSSSLGEESNHDYYTQSHQSTKSWRATTTKDTTASADEPLLTFGVIADIQFAPIPDGHSYSGMPRYYRHALTAAKHAAQHFETNKVALVLNLGDVIDGKCQAIQQHGGGDASISEHVNPGIHAVERALESLSHYTHGPILHTYGNHELYNCNRQVLQQMLNISFVKEPCGELVGYSSHLFNNNVRFVILHSYDVSLLQRCRNSLKYKTACSILQEHNPNYPHQENSPQGMEGLNKRFVAFNGSVGDLQLKWLKTTLQEARDANEKVVIASHQPILPESSNPVCLMWNYHHVLTILREYADVVVVSLSGHAHKGGYERDAESGIHFRVIEAVLESPSPIMTFGTVDVFEDRLVLTGFGDCTSAEYDFDHCLEAKKNKMANATLS
jgi:manganese-dependent ADP-ribose/CDP-alcohol diphosphatase